MDPKLLLKFLYHHSYLLLILNKPHIKKSTSTLLSLSRGPGLEVVKQLANHLLLSKVLALQYYQIVKVHLEDYLLNHKFKENNLKLPKRKQHTYLSPDSPHRLY